MSRDDFPEPQTGFVVTHFLVVSDQDRSRDYYQSVFRAEVVQERSRPGWWCNSAEQAASERAPEERRSERAACGGHRESSVGFGR